MNEDAEKFGRIAARAKIGLEMSRRYYTEFSAMGLWADAEFARENAHAMGD